MPELPSRKVEEQLYSFFNLGAGWELVVNATPRPLYTQERVPLVHEAGWARGPVWTGCGFDPRTIQPVASRYTDWATPA